MLGLWTESRQPKAETDGERYAFTVFIIFEIINIFVVSGLNLRPDFGKLVYN